MAERNFTDLELERSLVGDLSAERSSALATDATEADKQRLGELEAEHAKYLESVDVDHEVHRILQRAERYKPEPRRPLWLRWLIPIGGLAAAAAALVIFFKRPGPAKHPLDDDDLRTKGDDISLIIHGEANRFSSGDTITAGTKIRFEAQGSRPGFIAIVGIAKASPPTVYYPYGGHDAVALGERLLPGAIELDATPGDETFYALFSTKPFAIDPAVEALAAARPLPPNVVSSQVVLHKK